MAHEDETAKAAAAYAEYEAMPPQERSLSKLAAQMVAGKRTKPETMLRTVKKWSAAHDWQARVKTHDAENAAAKEAKRLAEIERMNERHAQIGVVQQVKAIEQIARLAQSPKGMGALAAVQLLKLSTDLERIARGAPTGVERHEVTGKDGGPVQHEHILNASEDFDRAIGALLDRAATGRLPVEPES